MAVLATLNVLMTSPAGADITGRNAAHLPLVGPDAQVNCDDLSPATGEDASEEGPGSVLFKVTSDDTVQATVRLRDAEPDTVYFVRLLQVGDGTCPGIGDELLTNARGNGSVTISQERLDGGSDLQVVVTNPETGEPPQYRAAERFIPKD